MYEDTMDPTPASAGRPYEPRLSRRSSLNQRYDYDVLVAGHVNRVGSKADVDNQLEFLQDLQAAAAEGLAQTKPGETVHRDDLGNPWAVFDNYIDRVVVQNCWPRTAASGSTRLRGRSSSRFSIRRSS